MRINAHLIPLIAAIAALLTPAARAQQVPITATAAVDSDIAYTGDRIRLTLVVDGTTEAIARTIRNVEGGSLELLRGPMPQTQSFTRIVNGRRFEQRTERTTFEYALSIDRPGQIVVPPFEVESNGQIVQSNAVVVTSRAPIDSAESFIEITLDDERVFVGQPVRARIVWYIPEGPQHANFSFRASEIDPALDPTALTSRGMANQRNLLPVQIFGLDTAGRRGTALRSGTRFITLTTDLSILPTEPGTHTLGPIIVTWDQSARRGSPPLRTAARSEPVTLEAIEPPLDGRPASWSGLIGDYGIRAAASPDVVNVGDPIELIVTITGDEPMTGVTTGPDLALQPAFADNFRLSSDGWRFEQTGRAGQRTFTTTIRATNADIEAIPPIELAYLDPDTDNYGIATTNPIPLEVRAVRRITAADAVRATTNPNAPSATDTIERSPLDPTASGIWAITTGPKVLAQEDFDPAEAITQPPAIALIAAPPAVCLIAATLAFAVRRQNPTQARRRSALSAALRALRTDGPERAIRIYTAAILDRPESAIAAADLNRLRHIEGEAGRELRNLLDAAESSRFGAPSQSADQPNDRATVATLLKRADRALRKATNHSEGAAA